MNRVRYIITAIASLFIFMSCDVHEFAVLSSEKVPFHLHLDFNTEMSFHKDVYYTKSVVDSTKSSAGSYDMRYIVNAYRDDNETRIPDTTFIFSRSEIENLNYTAVLQLPEGKYTFRVWADYVHEGSIDDLYYDTHDFSEIILSDKNVHHGSNDFRDAFHGSVSATVMNPALYIEDVAGTIDNKARVEMVRPMGKFKFISTDVDAFLGKLASMLKEHGILKDIDPDTKTYYDTLLKSINLEDFYTVFRYNVFMPCSFNVFTDKPADSWTGISFISPMQLDYESGMNLGFDYVFVNGSQTTLSISLEIYNKYGELMSATNPINVPIVRNRLTVVKGDFLTSEATGGVTINPEYDGEDFNIEIK